MYFIILVLGKITIKTYLYLFDKNGKLLTRTISISNSKLVGGRKLNQYKDVLQKYPQVVQPAVDDVAQ